MCGISIVAVFCVLVLLWEQIHKYIAKMIHTDTKIQILWRAKKVSATKHITTKRRHLSRITPKQPKPRLNRGLEPHRLLRSMWNLPQEPKLAKELKAKVCRRGAQISLTQIVVARAADISFGGDLVCSTPMLFSVFSFQF